MINEVIRLTPTQPVLSKGRWIEAGELRAGDMLTGADGSSTAILAIRKVAENVTVYNFGVTLGSYIAHGMVFHNKPYPYTLAPCPDCGGP